MQLSNEKKDDLHVLAVMLAKVVIDLFRNNAGFEFSTPPQLKREYIKVFNQKMRIYGVEKFFSPTFVSTVNYYKTADDLEINDPLGLLVVYVPQDYVPRLLRKLKYPLVDKNDDFALKDACGALANVIAGQFKSEVSSMGFIDLEMSHFSNYLNTSIRGIDYCLDQPEKYELSFFIEQQKRLVIEMSMGTIPRVY